MFSNFFNGINNSFVDQSVYSKKFLMWQTKRRHQQLMASLDKLLLNFR